MGSTIDLAIGFRHRILGLVLICATAGVYWQVQHNDFIQYDDPYYVTANRHVQAGLTKEGISWAFGSFAAANWHPLTWLSHMLDCQIYGLNPAGHHLTNLIFHVANTLLVLLLLRRLTGDLWRSFLVAGLFAVHPLHVESVAWIAERKDILCAFFSMLVLLSYGRYVETGKPRFYLLSLFLFGMGLLTKPMIVTLPFVLVLLDYWPLDRFPVKKRRKITGSETVSLKKLVVEKIPFLAFSAASSIITIVAQTKGGALQAFNTLPIGLRAINGMVSYVRYLLNTLLPKDLAVFYPHPGDSLSRQLGLSALLLIAVISAMAIYRIARQPYLFVGWFWFTGALIPVIGLVQVGSQALADRYTYFPHVGLFIAFVWGLSDVLSRWRVAIRLRCLLWGTIVCAFMVSTWVQVRYWQNSSVLFEHALRVTRDNYVAHFVLSRELGAQGMLDKALSHYSKAVEISPAFVAMMHNRIGYHLYSEGEYEAAATQFTGALDIQSDYIDAHNNLGVVLAHQGCYDEAIHHLNRVLVLSPGHRQAAESLENLKRQLIVF